MSKLLVFALVLATAVCTLGQDSDGKNELSVWGGYSPDSLTSIRFLGRTPDAKFGIVALRYARRLHEGENVKLRYTADAIPFSALSFPDIEITPTGVRGIRPTRYAWGFSPIGLQLSFRPQKKVQPFVDGSGGMLFYSKKTPNFVGTKANFTLHLGGGIEIATGENRSVSLGYKLFHISNADRGTSNPGFDNNLFYVGYKFHTW